MEFNFQKKHYDFIEIETKINQNQLEAMNEDELDDLYNEVCEIEIEEAAKTLKGADLTERGETAVEIVNIMAGALGYVDDSDWEEYQREISDED